MANARIRSEGAEVVLTIDGREVRLPYTAALEIAKVLFSAGKAAEEIALRESIITDQAILLRAGVPLGLTDHPHLQKEAVKTAMYDRDLRRYMPGGVKSGEVFGTPTVTNEKRATP
jgi:hypothetical protein